MQKRLGEKGDMAKVGDGLCVAVDAITDTTGVADSPRLFTDLATNDVPNTHATDVFRMVPDALRSLSRDDSDRGTKNSLRPLWQLI